MRKWSSLVIGTILIFAGITGGGSSDASQTTASPQPVAQARVDVDTPDDSLLRWPLPPGAEEYPSLTNEGTRPS